MSETLEVRLLEYYAQMAPHQRERMAGKLIEESIKRITTLETSNMKLRKALVGLVGMDGKELDGMEAMVRIMPVADNDRMNTINAIHALRETSTP